MLAGLANAQADHPLAIAHRDRGAYAGNLTASHRLAHAGGVNQFLRQFLELSCLLKRHRLSKHPSGGLAEQHNIAQPGPTVNGAGEAALPAKRPPAVDSLGRDDSMLKQERTEYDR